MSEFQVLITILFGGFGFTGAFLAVILNRIIKLDTRIDKLEMDMIDVKTILRAKECCMFNDDRQIRKVE